MATDYNRIREENIGRYGTETAHLALLGDLYSERTHFIFELLQNAEDAKATQVQFRLGENNLELCHDGRVFTPDDVRGISSICQSTNQGDPERIGRFGIGFKSVYAYTRRPEVHSGDEHFAIEHYVRPEEAVPRNATDHSTTLIVLPFNAASISASEAHREIKAAFARFDPINLLFLRHIQKVDLFVDGQGVTALVRKPVAQLSPSVRMVATSSSAAGFSEQRWLLFDRAVSVFTPAGKQIELRVEVAFSLTAGSSAQELKVVPRDRANLAVFFPTSRPTGTGFILQAPFIPTPDRSNVRENEPLNIRLANELAALVVASLRWLRDNGALSKATLAILPLKRADFSEDNLFRPLFDRVLRALKEERLLLGHSATSGPPAFVSGCQAKAASSSELRELISSNQLQELAGGGTDWGWLADGISVRGDSDLACYLRKEVGVCEVTASDFVSWLESQKADWWKTLDQGWLVRVYRYLQSQSAEHRRLRKLPLIRLESGEHVSPETQAVFFPADNIHEKKELAPFLPQLPIIRQSLVDDDEDKAIENFLRQMGVARLAATEFIRRVLIPRYSSPKGISAEENRTHVRFVFQAFQRMPAQEKQELISELRGLAWLLCRKATEPGKLFFVRPTQAYLPQQFTRNPALEIFFAAIPETFFVDPGYLCAGEEWIAFLSTLGCSRLPAFSDDKHDIVGLNEALKRLPTISVEDALHLSNAILDILSSLVPEDEWRRDSILQVSESVYGPRGGWHGHRQVEARFLGRLKNTAWLPDENGKLHTLDQLFEDTEQNRRLLGDSVSYLRKSVELNSEKLRWLLRQCGFHRGATKEAVLVRLKRLKTQTVPLLLVTPLYDFLAQSSADLSEPFEKGELIFCPDAEPPWRAPSEVFWEDESPVFGSTRGYLKKHYPKLREFFSSAGVPQSAGPTDYVQALLELSKLAVPDQATRIRIHRIYKRLIPRLEEGGDWQSEQTWRTYWAKLEIGCHWFGRKSTTFGFYRLDELVRVDNEHIAGLFQDELALWDFPDLNDFASTQLKIAPVSSAQCRFKVEGEGEVQADLANRLSEIWIFVTAFLESEKWQTAVREGAKSAISTAPTVRLAQRIAVTYELKGVSAEEFGGKDGFVDEEKAVVWLAQKADKDDLIEALGDALQEFFGPEVLREYICDLFRKDPKKAVEKWRKKGLILSPPRETAADVAAEPIPSTDKKDEASHGDDSTKATGLALEPNIIQTTPPDEPVSQKPTSANTSDTANGATPAPGVTPGVTVEQPTSAGVGLSQPKHATQVNPQTPEPANNAPLPRDTGGNRESPTTPAKEESRMAESPSDIPSDAPPKEIPQALHDAFNKPGETTISDDRPPSGPVKDPKKRLEGIIKEYADRKSGEPAASQRVTRRVIDVWDQKNKGIRDFLYEEYAGRCQICGETNRFPRRDGKAYFEAVYLIPHTAAAWTDGPGSVISLCALCSAKFQYGVVKCGNVADQIRTQKAVNDGGHSTPTVKIELIGKPATIEFSERHLLEVKGMLSVAHPDHPETGTISNNSQTTPPPSTVEDQKPPQSPNDPQPLALKDKWVRCPKCHRNAPLVRGDRFDRHITKAHSTKAHSSRVTGGAPYSPLPKPVKETTGLRRCRACGSPVVPGEDYCYSHM